MLAVMGQPDDTLRLVRDVPFSVGQRRAAFGGMAEAFCMGRHSHKEEPAEAAKIRY